MYETTLNGINYVEADTIKEKEITYSYLVNQNNTDDFIIRKIINKEGKEYYDALDNETEYNLALMYFIKKHAVN